MPQTTCDQQTTYSDCVCGFATNGCHGVPLGRTIKSWRCKTVECVAAHCALATGKKVTVITAYIGLNVIFAMWGITEWLVSPLYPCLGL